MMLGGYMKKLTIIVITLILFTTPFFTNISAFEQRSVEDNQNLGISQEQMLFSQAEITTKGDYVSIKIDEVDTYISEPGKPWLPVVVKTYNFQRNTKIKNIKCNFSDFIEQKIDKKVRPAPEPVPLSFIRQRKIKDEASFFDNGVYQSTDFYPEKMYEYDIKCGIEGLKVIVRLYPVSYKASKDIIKTYRNVDIKILYENLSFDTSLLENSENYDMVIIAPDEFTNKLQPLVNHKNDVGIKTFIKKTEEIFDEYDGRDKPEDIKLFIKDSIETFNISYVLLVGGLKGIKKEWYLPVRYSNLETYGSFTELGYLTDLYYSDIYKYNESSQMVEFDSWDSNNNNIFAEWYIRNESTDGSPNYVLYKDSIDGVPDVYLGRLACRNPSEVNTVVKKIISYESKGNIIDWKNKMVCIGGDTIPFSSENVYEGELETSLGGSYMKSSGYKIKTLFASDGTLKRPIDIMREMRKGTGFMYMSGHGNPGGWFTHPPKDDVWINGLLLRNMPFILNFKKLPIVVVGGCHNSQFNVTPLNLLEGIKKQGIDYFIKSGHFWRNEWVYECFSWRLIATKFGGAIATIGNTALGYGVGGEECTELLDGFMGTRFFKNIGINKCNTVGKAHSETISNFIDKFNINQGKTERKTIEQWALLGDPSLNIGFDYES